MVKHIQTIRQQIADELLSVFDQFVGLALKVLTMKRNKFKKYPHHTYFKNTAQKMKFFITDFFSKYDQIRRKPDLVTFTEEIHNGKLHFLYSRTSCCPDEKKIFDRKKQGMEK